MKGTKFSIVADIEAKATLAAITDHKQTEVLINGTGEEVTKLLVQLLSSCMLNYAKAVGAETKEEISERTAYYAASVIKMAGALALVDPELREALSEGGDE